MPRWHAEILPKPLALLGGLRPCSDQVVGSGYEGKREPSAFRATNAPRSVHMDRNDVPLVGHWKDRRVANLETVPGSDTHIPLFSQRTLDRLGKCSDVAGRTPSVVVPMDHVKAH